MEHLSHFDRQHQGEGKGGDDQEDGAESQEKGAETDTVLAESCNVIKLIQLMSRIRVSPVV